MNATGVTMFAVNATATRTKGWITCPKCHRRIFRWTRDSVEVAKGAKVMHPLARTENDNWRPNADEIAIAQCPRGHLASPPQPWPFS
jgi:hypothetical protein